MPKDVRPFDSSATVGIFLGWVMDAGCKFKGTYRVASLADFDKLSLLESNALPERRVYSTVTSRIAWPTEVIAKDPNVKWDFPLLERYEAESETGVGRLGRVSGHREVPNAAHPGSQGAVVVSSSSPPLTTVDAPLPPAPLGTMPAQSSAPAEPALVIPIDDGLYPATAKPPDYVALLPPPPAVPAHGDPLGTLDPAGKWPFALKG